MRHVWSLIAGVLIAPLAWFLIAFGQGAMSRGQSSNDFGDNFILGGLLITGIGLVLGLISSLRTSPVGALIAAVVFLGSGMFYLFAPNDALNVLSREVTIGDYKTNLAEPLNHGTLVVVGGMLLMAIFSAARWRSSSDAAVEPWAPPAPPAPWEPPAPVSPGSAETPSSATGSFGSTGSYGSTGSTGSYGSGGSFGSTGTFGSPSGGETRPS